MSSSSKSRHGRARVGVACDNCREKKCRCDGSRPTCSRCKMLSLSCHYSKTKKVKDQKVMQELAATVAQYEMLLRKSLPAHDAVSRGTQKTEHQSPSLSSLSQPVSSNASEAMIGLSSADTVPFFTTASVPSTPQSSHSRAPADLLPGDLESWGHDLLQKISLPPRPLLERALSAFFEATAVLFAFFEDGEIASMLDEVYGRDNDFPPDVKLVQLCAVAAVGCQYYPSRFDPVTRTAFLSTVKLYFDECIEETPLSAMRIAAILCMYFTFEKRSVALTYVNIGLCLAKTTRNEIVFLAHSITPWQRVFHSLVFLESWLCATTGYLPSTQNCDLYSTISFISTINSSESTVIQNEMVKIAIMTTLILQDVYHARFVASVTLNSYKDRLQQWLLNLPDSVRLDRLTHLGSDTGYLRAVFNIHLLYMTTVTLIYRRVLIDLAGFGLRVPDAEVFNQTQLFLLPCLWTGRQVAKVLEIAMSQDLVLHKCWMFINAARTTCNVLLYFIVNQLLRGNLSEELSQDMAATKQCLDVLSFCSKMDQSARGYLTRANSLFGQTTDTIELMMSRSTDIADVKEVTHQRQQLLQVLRGVTELLVHQYDGGFRRSTNSIREIALNPKSGLKTEGSLFTHADPSAGSNSESSSFIHEGGMYFFISDALYTKPPEERFEKGEHEELSSDARTAASMSMNNAIFGS